MTQKIMLTGDCLFYVEQMVQAEPAAAVEQVVLTVIMVIMEHRAAVEPVAQVEPVVLTETMVIMAHQAPAAQVAATPV